MRISTKIWVAQCWFFYPHSTRRNRLFGSHFRHSNDNYVSQVQKMLNSKVKILLTLSSRDEKRARVIQHIDRYERAMAQCRFSLLRRLSWQRFAHGGQSRWVTVQFHAILYYIGFITQKLTILALTPPRLSLCPVSQKLPYVCIEITRHVKPLINVKVNGLFLKNNSPIATDRWTSPRWRH